MTIHKRTNIGFLYPGFDGKLPDGIQSAGMSGYKDVFLTLDGNEADKLCTDDNYGWSTDPWDS